MNEPLFSGVCTALVTPFLQDRINYPMLQQLILRQINAGVNAVVLAGTTGESATLSDLEKLELIQKGKQYAGNECLIIAGTGSNSTEHAIALSKEAEEAGADALLIVSPYYNKSTDEGLFRHYMSIAHNVSIPIILYNVPSRTGVDIPVSVYQRLSAIPNIAGVKEAGTDMGKIIRIRRSCHPSFHIWSGNDELTLPVISLGGKGVISVTSNVYPLEMQQLCHMALNGNYEAAAVLQQELQPIQEALFCEINPIPVKAAMSFIGYDCGKCRMPLTELAPQHWETLKAKLQ